VNRRLKALKLASLMTVLLAAGCGADTPSSVTTASSTSSSPPAPTSSPSPSAEVRTHVLSEASGGAVGVTVTVPASGWIGTPGGWAMERLPQSFDPPAGAGIIAFVVDEEFYVYGDPCEWKSTRPATPATTVDEIIDDLASQASRDPSMPEKITVDGYAGKKLTLHVPDDVPFEGGDDARFTDCDGGTFATLGVAGEDPALWAQGPGEIDEIWVVDVDGRIVLLEGGYYPATPPDVVDEAHEILRSATFV
jgi:hypothetical protein